MLNYDIQTGRLDDASFQLTFADRPYQYAITGSVNGLAFTDEPLVKRRIERDGDVTTFTGLFNAAGVQLDQVIRPMGTGIEETITLYNICGWSVELTQLKIGFTSALDTHPDWRLCVIPFRVQLDGSVHDYTAQALIGGQFHNAVYSDKTRPEPSLSEDGILRSEAWAWGDGDQGLVIIKYNNAAIELSVAAPERRDGENVLRFGGAGFSLYGEPSAARALAPGAEFTFGTTTYIPYRGGLSRAYEIYRDAIDAHGHGFPADYNPPVNWNELYDVGWYHSNPEKLKQFYTRDALLKEAAKARDVGCDLLYLDPGWEVAEGTTLWDEARLGPVADFIKTLKQDYGLDLAYRTILRCYKDHWPHRYMVKHPDRDVAELTYYPGADGWELCLPNPEYWQEKLRRILAISKNGVRFMMFDEMDWRGACTDPAHGHAVPGTPMEHVMAYYGLTREVRRQCHDLTIEAHDPVWPWSTCIYVPTYFQQGFGEAGAYDENWGFEYMWDCLNDLRTGRALALYYYALGCNVPLYLHITMAADNDRCVFFWWTASTVRHMGIGGKDSNKTIEPGGGLPPYDHDKRFAAYQAHMRTYNRLKPYFVRGRFHGIAENIHLHTLPGTPGGVINVFNLTDAEQTYEFDVPYDRLGAAQPLLVKGAQASWTADGVRLRLTLPPMSPGLIEIGC
ncbi:MAG: hypothetical protein M1434_05025 [Chloroflexi bacterium]|nr:hypothetical protein [Chloroflexota bacterium]